jgi:hypothetical protein
MRGHLGLLSTAVGIAVTLAVTQPSAAAAEPSQRDRLLAAFDRILGNYAGEFDEWELSTAAINGVTRRARLPVRIHQ